MPRHLAGMDHRRRGLARGREVHRHRAHAQLLEAIAQEEELAALRVEGPRDVSGAAGGCGHRKLDHPGVPAAFRQRRGSPRERRHRDRRFRPPVDEPVTRRGQWVRRVPSGEAAHRPVGGRARESAGCLARRRVVGGAPHRVDPHLVGLRARREGALGKRERFIRRVVGTGVHAEELLLQMAIGRQLGRWHGARDAAIDHDVDGVGHVDGHAQVLLDEEHRDLAVRGQVLQHARDLLHDHRGEALGRLVHHEEHGIEEEGARDGQHLLFAAGQLRPAIVATLGQAREDLVDAGHRPRPALGAHGEAEVFVDAERRPDPAPLRHVADAPLRDEVGRQAEDLLAGEPHAARGGDEPGDGVAECGLPHAVATDHRDHAVVQGERDLLQGMGAAVVDVEPLHLEDGPRGPAWPPAGVPGHQRCPPPM